MILPIVRIDVTAAKRSSNAELPLSFIPFRGIRPAVVVAPTPFQTFTLVAVTRLARFSTNVPRCSDSPIEKTKIPRRLQDGAVSKACPAVLRAALGMRYKWVDL